MHVLSMCLYLIDVWFLSISLWRRWVLFGKPGAPEVDVGVPE
jgi:hypothetical protein